eukprot:gnl/MRDRNA2_/MRDRNA2_100000_c0_seq1.p1 gnl/MRDRNA2_/MRDRNA2_100000_c0~~gnl/MRDRNA2_/MRDRNA2_100000_c0_seq1.p1  ORF type:complete len:228 (+),score=37.82 gnl/MRDRNA2_/MRDRNA2_100000_c0_seq1:117-800(+)
MLRALLFAKFCFSPCPAIVRQEGRNFETVGAGHRNTQYPVSESESVKPMGKDDAKDTRSAVINLSGHTAKLQSQTLTQLSQQHSLSIQRKSHVSSAHPAPAMLSKAYKANRHMKAWNINISMTMIIIFFASVTVAGASLVIMTKSQNKSFERIDDPEGVISSSDVTSSQSGSTDRELKNRMDNFERRLEEHKRMMEVVQEEEPGTTSDRLSITSLSRPVRPSWMVKK